MISNKSTTPSTSAIITQGYLKKKSPNTFMKFGRLQWQKRYFVLEKEKLCYYKTEKEKQSGVEPTGKE